MNRALARLLLAVLVSLPVGANGQVGLRGVTAVSIEIETADDATKDCGVSADALDAALRLPLAHSRLPVKSNAATYVLVQVHASKLGPAIDGCTGVFTLTVMRPVWFSPSQGPSTNAGVWAVTQLKWGPRASFGNGLVDEVERSAKLLVAAWLRANE